jgi:hypothetical protein
VASGGGLDKSSRRFGLRCEFTNAQAEIGAAPSPRYSFAMKFAGYRYRLADAELLAKFANEVAAQ